MTPDLLFRYIAFAGLGFAVCAACAFTLFQIGRFVNCVVTGLLRGGD